MLPLLILGANYTYFWHLHSIICGPGDYNETLWLRGIAIMVASYLSLKQYNGTEGFNCGWV